MTSKFNVGDRVKIVNYGNKVWFSNKETGGFYFHDLQPELVGKEQTVIGIKFTQGFPQYSLTDVSWMNEDQIELIS